jgi:hypothetical protein
MKLNFLRIRTNNQLKSNKALRASIPYKHAVSVGIIYSIEDKQKHDHIKEFVHRLEKDGKKVQVIAYLPNKKENYEFLFDFFTLKDVSFWGSITSRNALKFSEATFDYLYYLDTEPNPLILHLLARSKAKCRVGKFWDARKPFFEMMIDSAANTPSLIDGIYKYTTQLR